MVMSVGICECGCGEFGHDVGGLWDELNQPEYEGWQQHQCTRRCSNPCLLARCRESLEGDGFWVWCRDCDIQCSGSFEEWSDEPQEDQSNDADEDEDEIQPDYNKANTERFASNWKPIDIGTQIRVDFSEENFVITDAVILNKFGDLARLNTLAVWPNEPKVRAFFATAPDGFEVLVDLSEIIEVI